MPIVLYVQYVPVLRIRIRYLRIRILEFFPNPDPDPGQKHIFKGNNKILGESLVFNQKSRYFNFVFNQKSMYVPTGIFLNREVIWFNF